MRFSYGFVGCLLVVFLVVQGCKDEDRRVRVFDVAGYVQKGPYIIGTIIEVSELNAALRQTGNVFTTEVSDNSGSFQLDNISLASGFVQLSASGYYFNEVDGDISSGMLTLNAISDLTNVPTANVNILTHLEKHRVEYLVGQGSTFSEAKTTAQSEVLAAFGLSPGEIDNSELLDITMHNDGGAVLLALSVILQGGRSIGELAELLAVFLNDIQQDGTLDNAPLINALRASAKDLELSSIRANLETRYAEIGEASTVPDFEQYVGAFLAFTGEQPTSSTLPAENVTAFSARLRGISNAGSLPTSVSFEYGTSTDYGSSVSATPANIAGHDDMAVSAEITLTPATTYHFRMISENAKGVAYGEDMVFTTLGGPPIVSTSVATNVKPSMCEINGVVNPHFLPTTVSFEYGTTTTYENSVTVEGGPFTGDTDIIVGSTISGLAFGQTYHFRIRAENSSGVVFGDDFTVIPFYPIGSSFQGGLLAYVLNSQDPGYDPETPHGLIVAPSDLGSYQWATWDVAPPRTGVNATDIGSGKSNTEILSGRYIYAAIACHDLILNDFDDWFLPSLDELKVLVPNRAILGLKDESNDYYWTSSDGNFGTNLAWDAWVFYYSTGMERTRTKDEFHWVRPMRYF